MSSLIPVEHQSQRILTTEQLAEVYETESRRITENFQRNQDRFIEGKHYYLLQGEGLKVFLQDAQSVVQNPSKVRSLYLWTERGASRHCKILDTDKAWEQFDNLEETYFNPKRRKSLVEPSYSEFDSRGLHRKNSLSALNKEGILVKGRSPHFTKRVRIFKSRIVRAVFVRVEGMEVNLTA